MGDQLAVCDTKRDLTFIITSDNQGERAARHVIYHEYYRHFIEYAGDLPLPENSQTALTLSRYLDSRRLVAQYGERTSLLAPLISGVRYKAQIASQGITAFTLTLGDTEGCVTVEMGEVTHTLEFGLSENKLTDFSFGQRARPDMMGVYEEGKYRTCASGAWVSDHAFTVMAQVIDTYLGCLCLHISYKDRRATLSVSRYGQYVFEDMGGYVIAAAE
jgi:hypothetical protein